MWIVARSEVGKISFLSLIIKVLVQVLSKVPISHATMRFLGLVNRANGMKSMLITC